jgi:hypothetical protein
MIEASIASLRLVSFVIFAAHAVDPIALANASMFAACRPGTVTIQ